MHRWLPLAVLLAASPALAGRRQAPPPDPAATAAELLGRALQSDEAYEELRSLCDDIGARLSGSPALEKAVRWAEGRMEADGLDVTLEPVTVPKWVRGQESASILSPVADELEVLGLGGTVSTPPEGLEADVLVVTSFEELAVRSAEAEGRIVVYDVPFTDYGQTVRYRWSGASEAARHGAVAALVRSVTPESLYTPHTGGMGYAEDAPRIPTAAITIEDATRLHRLQTSGHTPRIRLVLQSEDAGAAPSHNVVGEVRGRGAPNEIVVLGCHLDSWDVGQGAQDDGAGCVTAMEAVAQLAALPVPPRRTVRAVLYTNEENGLRGGRAYAAVHADERIVAAVEDDTGSGAPLGFRFEVPEGGDEAALRARFAPYLPWLAPVGADVLAEGGSGADVHPLVTSQGTVGFGLNHDMTGYWPIHHTEADTFEKVDPALMKRNVAAMTVLAWILAETDAVEAGR